MIIFHKKARKNFEKSVNYNFSICITDEKIENTERYSLIYILNSDTSIEEISKIDHVQTIYNSKYNVISSYESSFKTDNLDGGINLMYSDNTLQPTIIKGRNILENERNVAICPIEFFPDSKVNEYKINNAVNRILDIMEE